MAKVHNNIFVRGLSGSLGDQFIVRRGKGGDTIIAAKTAIARQFNATQLAHQDAFRMAIAYAKTAKTQAVYISKAEGTEKSPFNVAVADWFNKPAVLEINPNAWTGEIGEIIKVQAQDDTYVAKVHLVIRDESDVILEEGDAIRGDGLWWNYTTKTVIPRNPTKMTAQVYDLAGNLGEMTMEF